MQMSIRQSPSWLSIIKARFLFCSNKCAVKSIIKIIVSIIDELIIAGGG